jgi:hypothetical protein
MAHSILHIDKITHRHTKQRRERDRKRKRQKTKRGAPHIRKIETRGSNKERRHVVEYRPCKTHNENENENARERENATYNAIVCSGSE